MTRSEAEAHYIDPLLERVIEIQNDLKQLSCIETTLIHQYGESYYTMSRNAMLSNLSTLEKILDCVRGEFNLESTEEDDSEE